MSALTLPTSGFPVSPRHRGRLVLAQRVVEKVAAQAAAELSLTSGRSGGLLGFGSDADAGARPKVDVQLSGRSADLTLEVGIAYPGSIRSATHLVREHVTRRVEELTGVDVRRVDVEVAFLTSRAAGPARVLR
ncbi:Asp23/Gls24 family envelope stress response protein [uncultured Friedmanniella sp.]|uniref:Asp23/Gls24 family envelope stress response protein n=1 Tax=uncultured Friedmanniella sp. TaxID=335381 RepID=UPI0035CC6161